MRDSLQFNIKYLFLALIPGGMIFGPIPFNPILYYIFLGILAILSISGSRRTNLLPIILIIAGALSIIIGHPASVFKSWSRLGLFALLLLGVFPIFDSPKIQTVRNKLFISTVWLCAFIGVSGVFCYFAGINYSSSPFHDTSEMLDMAGLFAGLSKHSMMLGPCGAIGIVFCSWLSNKTHNKFFKYTCWICAFLCLLTTFLSASRGASLGGIIGFTTYIYILNKGKFSKIIGIGIILIGIFALISPSLERFTQPLMNKQEHNEEEGGMLYSRQSKWNNRISEFKSSPIFGVGFAAMDTKNKGDYDNYTGTTETGSSWLALLSMTGLIGFSIFCSIFFPIVRLLKTKALKTRTSGEAALLLPLVAIFFTTMFTEGYVLAGGSFFCYFFWLLLGVSYSETH